MIRLWMVLLGGLVFAQMALADEAPDCKNPVDQMTMTACAGLEFEKADVELNNVWKKLKASIDDQDATALLKSQRAWIAYRDAQCELAGFAARGGSLQPMLVQMCLADLTLARIKELNSVATEE